MALNFRCGPHVGKDLKDTCKQINEGVAAEYSANIV